MFRRVLGRWLRKKGTITPQTQANELVRLASGRGYKLLIDPEFRRLMEMDSVDQFEDGRITNELVAGMLTLLFVNLRSEIPNIDGERREFWRSVLEEIIPSYTAWLSEIGVDKNFVEIWDQLLHKRFKEYDDYERDAIEYEEQNPMDVGTAAQQEAYLPIMTIAGYTVMYLRHGKKTSDDKKLMHVFQQHLVQFQNDLMAQIGW